MSSGQALALGLVIWLLAVAAILTWIQGATRKAALKLYDPQTSEPSFWAAPASETKTRKPQER